MNIFIVGTGYVGLVTGACLSQLGHTVTCLDIDEKKIARLQSGDIPFYEPGLKELVASCRLKSQLFFTTKFSDISAQTEAIFLAVPTPSLPCGSCDLSYFHSAAESIAKHLIGYCVIINKSTVPCGTYKQIEEIFSSYCNHQAEFDIVSNPEFLKEGSAIDDYLHPDRIIIGTDSPRAKAVMQQLYTPLTDKGFPLLFMDRASSELTKYAANAALAMRISFMNELSHLCEKLGANIEVVKQGMGSDKRIGKHFLNAGVGYGGSCFPKDIKALLRCAKDLGVSLSILEATEAANEKQKISLVKKMELYFREDQGIAGKKVTLWGLSFKPNTDDMRQAPSIDIIKELHRLGCQISAYDPVSSSNAKEVIDQLYGVNYSPTPQAAAENADAIILITEWDVFKNIDLKEIKKVMKGKSFFDGRNLFDPVDMHLLGFDYFAIGIPPFSHVSTSSFAIF